MWSYSEAAIEPSSHKTITLYLLTTTCRSYFLVKLQVWIIHVDTWRRFSDDTRSIRLHIDFASTLKRLCLSKGMQLYKTINSVKSIFLGFSAMVPNSYDVQKVSENTYFVFYILPFKDCFSLILLIKKFMESFAF